MQPKVSMVIPCYNKAEYIGGMFDSILVQQWDNIELILVNDGSTDATREIIAAYEPSFISRGYEVVIVDQENKGVASAVYEGLKRVTGDFVCQIDADDELDPEYVCVLAGWLAEHPDCDWVVCDADRTTFLPESDPALANCRQADTSGFFPYSVAESILINRVFGGVWIHMFRRSYFLSCGMLQSFVTENCPSQEMQVLLPLALGGARPFYIRRRLYNWKTCENSITTSLSNDEKKLQYVRGYADSAKKVLSHLTDDQFLHGVVLPTGNLIREHYQEGGFNEYNEREQIEKLADIIDQSGLTCEKVDIGIVMESGFEPLSRAFSNRVIGYRPPKSAIMRKPGGRLIAYAAFGKASRRMRHGLLRSDIRPDVFWDAAAKPGDNIDGVPVTPPDFESLSPRDVCLVLLKNRRIVEEVSSSLDNRLPRENIWCFPDVIDYLVDYFYGGKFEIEAGL